jgi:diacylglycerol kinase family enzyme
MRAAAILGLGSSTRDLKPFQQGSLVDWVIGLPAEREGLDAILVFGGDGTVHRHLGALVVLGLPVLVVPAGSGNDFARALGLFRVHDSLAAWRTFAADEENVRRVDLGLITPLSRVAAEAALDDGTPTARLEVCPDTNQPSAGAAVETVSGGRGRPPLHRQPDACQAGSIESDGAASGAEGRLPLYGRSQDARGKPMYFSCVAGVGLDGEISRRANSLPRWLRAHGGYALSLPAALLGFRAFSLRLSVAQSGGASEFVLRSQEPVVAAVFANTPVYGGGMKIAPMAKMDDGQLDVCVIRDISKLKLLGVFPSVYFGRHLGIREVEYFSAGCARVETGHPLDVYADGEFVCRTPIEVGVAREALRVIVPV